MRGEPNTFSHSTHNQAGCNDGEHQLKQVQTNERGIVVANDQGSPDLTPLKEQEGRRIANKSANGITKA